SPVSEPGREQRRFAVARQGKVAAPNGRPRPAALLAQRAPRPPAPRAVSHHPRRPPASDNSPLPEACRSASMASEAERERGDREVRGSRRVQTARSRQRRGRAYFFPNQKLPPTERGLRGKLRNSHWQ